MKDTKWYFDVALERNAIMLDEANLKSSTFPLFSLISQELVDISLGKGLSLGYSYPGGKKSLRKLIAENESYLEGVDINSEEVIVNSGGCSGTFDNIFRILSSDIAKTGRNQIVLSAPLYPEVLTSIKFNGLEPILVPTKFENGFQPTSEEISDAVTKNTAAIFVVSPGNPSCKYIPQSELIKIAKLSEKMGAYMIHDAVFDESPSAQRGTGIMHYPYDKIIKIKGLSKDRPQLNDLRIGWCISRDGNLNPRLMNAAEVSAFSNSTISERLVLVDMKYRIMLKENRLEEGVSLYAQELTKYQKTIEEGMNSSMQLMNAHPLIDRITIPEAGNIIFARVSESVGLKNSDQLFDYLLDKKNIMVSPGHLFLPPPEEIWFRVTMNRDPKEFSGYIKTMLEALGDKIV